MVVLPSTSISNEHLPPLAVENSSSLNLQTQSASSYQTESAGGLSTPLSYALSEINPVLSDIPQGVTPLSDFSRPSWVAPPTELLSSLVGSFVTNDTSSSLEVRTSSDSLSEIPSISSFPAIGSDIVTVAASAVPPFSAPTGAWSSNSPVDEKASSTEAVRDSLEDREPPEVLTITPTVESSLFNVAVADYEES